MAGPADISWMQEGQQAQGTAAAGPGPGAVDVRTRRSRGWLLLWLLPFLLLGAARALLAVHDVGLLVAVLSWSIAMVFVAAVLGTISAT
jgi:hypothetical protein